MWMRGVLPLLVLVAGCAGNVDVDYPTPAGAGAEDVGQVVIRFTEPMTSVSVLVDGLLLAEEEHTERVEINGVPAGPHEITVAASESTRTRSVRHTERLMVEAGQATIVLLDTPPRSTGYWIQSSIAWLWPIVWILAR